MSWLLRVVGRFAVNPWAQASRDGREARYRLLADMSGMLLGNADPDAVLRLLMERAPEDLGLDICVSYCADEERRTLRATYDVGAGGDLRDRIADLPYGQGLCGRVAVTRQAVAMGNLVWSDHPDAQIVRASGFRAYAGFPLLAEGGRGDLLGVLAFGSRRIDSFAEPDISFLAAVAHHVAAARDRNRARQILEEREELFRTLANSLPQLAWMARPGGHVFWYNERWYEFTGTTPPEMEGWGWVKVYHPDHVDRVTASLQHSWNTGEPWEDTFPMRRHDGEWRWFLSRALPVRDSEGRLVLWLGTNTDITESRAAREEAEAANQSKSRFLAAASHDLRQPMQSMMLMASVLEGQIQSDAARRTLVHLQRGMDALKGLLDGLLDVSRLDAGILEPNYQEVPLRDLLEAISSTFEPVASGKGLAWTMAPCDLTVRTDPTLLGRILRNLAENAVRYTDRGGVSVACGPTPDGMVRITISDTGIGIPSEHLERIWEEFHQVGNSERDRSQGTGLGLAIVRRLSQLMGVPVDVKSQPGRGSAFTLSVPLAEAAAAAAAAAAPGPAAVDGRSTVLVVDDDAMVLLALQSIFRLWGYRVLIAGSGPQALDVLRGMEEELDLLVSDFRLRDGETGIDAIVAIRRHLGRAVPGIVLTGEAGNQAEAAAHAMELGFVHKPVTPRQLARQVEICTGYRPRAPELAEPERMAQ